MLRFCLSPLFTDGAVLQRGKNIRVFGTGENGVSLRVEICGETAFCTVKDGKWTAVIPPLSPITSAVFAVSDTETGEEIRLENVAVGEVWLAGGQSNMEFELCNCKGGEGFLRNDETPNVRYYYFPKRTLLDDDHAEQVNNARWTDFSDKESARHWSAVAYFCAKEMSERLGVVVGIIGCNWGGTSASCWIDRKYVVGDATVYFEEYDKFMSERTTEKAIADYRDYQRYQAAWETRKNEYVKTHPTASETEIEAACGENRYPGPKAPCDPCSPGVLYNSMVKFVAPYTLGGVLWYQGETDETHPNAYYTLLTSLIRNWRELWHDDELPFVIGQLPMYAGGNPDGDEWSIIRDAQMRVFRTVKNTGIAVLADCGERDNIHPVDKRNVGHRFALQVINLIGGCEDAFAPTVSNVIWNESDVKLVVENTGDPLCCNGEPSGFEICGYDGIYCPAKADIITDNGITKIVVSSDKVKQPRGVRYLWKNYAEVNIFGASGLPLVPFSYTV